MLFINIAQVTIGKEAAQKLLASGSGDGALLYIYLQSGNPMESAADELKMQNGRLSCAMATLRQLGLWQEEKPRFLRPSEPPKYTEMDVCEAINKEPPFQALYGEIQRILGRTLTVEELKILLGIVRYLGLPEDVVCVLVNYCLSRQKGYRTSFRVIEKEAYFWAERGITNMAEAAAFIHNQNLYFSRLGQLKRILQIGSRNLTAGEEKYAKAWLDMGFTDDIIALAYERTCLNTGGLSWAYMNTILTRWKESGYVTVEDVKAKDQPGRKAQKSQGRQLDAEEQAAIKRMLEEE